MDYRRVLLPQRYNTYQHFPVERFPTDSGFGTEELYRRVLRHRGRVFGAKLFLSAKLFLNDGALLGH